MVSSYTTNKAFEKPANGDYVDTWNIPVNGDWDIADKAFGGTYSVSLTNVNVTLTQANCQNVRIRLTGSISGNITIYFPAAVSGFFIVTNDTTGSYSITLASAGGAPGTSVTAPQAKTTFVFTDGSNVIFADDDRVTVTGGTGITVTGTSAYTVALTTPVAVANGGTGVTTSTGTGSVVLSASPALTGVPTAPTAALGTSTTQMATTAFVANAIAAIVSIPAGVILMWSGSIATIPTGWVLCDGNNSTPDLRNRFIVGAGTGSSYAVGATGGADSITLSTSQIPSHTHTFSATTGNMSANSTHSHTISDPGHTHSYTRVNNSIIYQFTSESTTAYYDTTTATTGSSTTGISVNSASTQHTHTVSGTTDAAGSGGSHENRPPYYALCYIMKT